MINKLKFVMPIILMAIISFSCEEDEIGNPAISDVTFIEIGEDNSEQIVGSGQVGVPLTFQVTTDGDLCTLWPAGVRNILKSQLDASKDSIDVYGNVVLVASDDFQDYGLVGARGKMMTGSNARGYRFTYTYANPGTYEVVIIATKHGVSDAQYKNEIITRSLVIN